jgi:hypothetical protein
MVIIDAELSAPPSEVCLFRDVTLFSNFFLKRDIVLECPKEYRDYYYKWLKNMCAWDYVLDFVRPRSELGITIRTNSANISIEKIDYTNYSRIINDLQKYNL